jgi:tetratricopeptide (TPR) repeat protein
MGYSGDYYQRTIEDDSASEIDLVHGNKLFFSSQYDAALKIYQDLLKKEGNDPNLLCQMGICYYFKRDYDQSAQLLDKALSIDRKHHLSHKWMGNVLLKTGNPIEARGHLDRALPRVTKELLPLMIDGNRYGGVSWGWLSTDENKPTDKKGANKFFLGCILDYQRIAEDAWEVAKNFAEEYYKDPENLWDEIVKNSLEWNIQEYKLHPDFDGHQNVWKIGKRIVDTYSGDVRKAWLNHSPNEIIANIFQLFDTKPTDYAKLPRMVLGGLQDTKQIAEFQLDLAPDTHIRKVLGRMVYGIDKLSVKEALVLSRRLYPKNPWLLDAELYLTGKERCFFDRPNCKNCKKLLVCTYGALNV